MAPKTITVIDDRGAKSTEAVGSETGYQSLLNRLGVLFLTHKEKGFNVNDFESLTDRNTYTLGEQQQPALASAAINRKSNAHAGTAVAGMSKFFRQDAAKLVVDETDHVTVERMEWFDDQIDRVYWRSCYSYILCSTIAFFENGHAQYAAAASGEPRQFKSMVLTGVQGTGKSVLGPFIGLFMARFFGWQVHYTLGNHEMTFGVPAALSKAIHIIDLSRGTSQPQVYPLGFVLLISSANKTRWHDLAQQQTWSMVDGNYCFMDPANEQEIEVIAANRAKDDDKREELVAEAQKAFKTAGGVLRLCTRSESVVRELVGTAIASYSINQVVNKVSAFDDELSEAGAGTEIYPGLVGHMVPSNRFRNTFEVKPPSPFVARELVKAEEAKSGKNLHGILADLLAIPKARGFACWIWEPLLTKKMAGDDAHISIVGSELPVGTHEATVLLHEPASEIRCVSFKTIEEFQTEAIKCVNEDEDFCLFAKAESDSFEAIDAIIVIKKPDTFIIAAQQLTVAEEYHPVLQAMIIEFMHACDAIAKVKLNPKLPLKRQLWFLQPEQSLSYFGFVKLQAMKFDQLTFPSPNKADTTASADSSSIRKSSRKRLRPEYVGNWVPSEQPAGRMQSNNRKYWDATVRTLEQFVGIVRISEGPNRDTKGDSIQAVFRRKLEDVGQVKQDALGRLNREPVLRNWSKTTLVMSQLLSGLDTSFAVAIQRDMACDQRALEDAGFLVGLRKPSRCHASGLV